MDDYNDMSYSPGLSVPPGAAEPMTFALTKHAGGRWHLCKASAALCSALGLCATPTLADMLAVMYPDDRDGFSAACVRCAATQMPLLHEYRVVREGGRVLWLCISALPLPAPGASQYWAGFVVDITARKASEEQSRFLTARNRLLMRTATDGLHILDGDGYVVEASDNFASLLGYTAAEMRSLHVSAWHEGWNQNDRWETLQDHAAVGQSHTFEAIYRRKNGLRFHVEIFASTAVFAGKIYISSTSHDVSGRKRVENELRTSAAAFEAKQSMFITDALRRVVKVNLAFSEQTGFEAMDTIGKLPPLFRSGLYDDDVFASMWHTARTDGYWSGELRNRRKDGTVYPVRVSLTAVHRADGAIASYVGTEADISAQHESEQRIARLAYYDGLTGLPNRRLLHERLAHAIALSRRSGVLGAVLFIDLDHFKQLNDSAGHEAGDLLLVQLGRRLVGSLREADTVARLGGDEFVVVLENLDAKSSIAAGMARDVCGKLLAELNVPYQLGTHIHQSTPSIGCTLFGEREETGDDLIKRADLAMYQAKSSGRNGVRFFDAAMLRSTDAREGQIEAIRAGIAAGQFILHYQPQLAMDGAAFGVEALARWQDPERGLLGPAEFIGLAEESGLICELGQRLLQVACQQLHSWSQVPALAATHLSVNISARQFRQRDFTDQVLACVRNAHADPTRLTLEITESTLVDNIHEASKTMNALKAHGINFSLDDFGVGYSSLSYLKQLPFDQIKIDRAFVTDIAVDARAAAIAATIIALGRNLGLAVVAEGVETTAQRDCLQALGCDAYQGYLLAAALPAADLSDFVAAGANLRNRRGTNR